MKVSIRPSGDSAGAEAESLKSVSCTYSEGEVTGLLLYTPKYQIAMPTASAAPAPAAAQLRDLWRARARGSAVATGALRDSITRFARSSSARMSEAL